MNPHAEPANFSLQPGDKGFLLVLVRGAGRHNPLAAKLRGLFVQIDVVAAQSQNPRAFQARQSAADHGHAFGNGRLCRDVVFRLAQQFGVHRAADAGRLNFRSVIEGEAVQAADAAADGSVISGFGLFQPAGIGEQGAAQADEVGLSFLQSPFRHQGFAQFGHGDDRRGTDLFDRFRGGQHIGRGEEIGAGNIPDPLLRAG